ncbi:hypothetical protein NDU88_005736 [Pleurodeles waltl]|uniref:Uncharacterized protein n=1 Tax=Pleurodeles waltl TaxID=8319 RepID=A0AAV7NND1_PLEWA|nr:hypothetical protein NDU88_005736 [Pleurodeles waltl]
MPHPPSFPNQSLAMSMFQTSLRRYTSLPRCLELACLFTCSVAGAPHSLLHCFTALARRRATQMPARGSKAAPAGVGAGAAVRQKIICGSGGAGEYKAVRASTRTAGELDKIKLESSTKLASVPLGKYFKVKTHDDLAKKRKDTTDNSSDICGNVESNVNMLSGDSVTEQEDGEIHKEPLQTAKVDVPLTPVRINLSTEEAEEGRKLEISNDSTSRDTIAQAEAQALTQALVHDLSSLNMGEEVQESEEIWGKRRLTSKNGQDLDLGVRFLYLSDQSSWTSKEAIEFREGGSRAWRSSWSEASSKTTTPGEDEDEKSEQGMGPGPPENSKVATVRKKMKKRISGSGSLSRQTFTKTSKNLQWDYSSAPGLVALAPWVAL